MAEDYRRIPTDDDEATRHEEETERTKELKKLKLSELERRAVESGSTADEVEQAKDDDFPKKALIGLIKSKRKRSLDYTAVQEDMKEKCSEQIEQMEEKLEKKKKLLEGVNYAWTKRVESVTKKKDEIEQSLQDLKAQMEAFDAIPDEEKVEDQRDLEPTAPENTCLDWVRGPRFTAFCSLVVVINLVTMFMEMLHTSYVEKFFVLDQVVLIFYITELVLKFLLYRCDLFCGPCSWVSWNWLDFIIVLVGILDQWVQPFVFPKSDSDSSQSSSAVQLVKMLRLARLARILKTVRAFMQSDLSWAEGDSFQLFIIYTIAFNSLVMSFESDYPDFWGWFYVEQVLLMIFSFELLIRLRHFGLRFFIHPKDFAWNWLDFMIVFGGILDQWLMPSIKLVQALMGMKQTNMFDVGEFMTTLRMARLLRILRLVRLVKNIPPLFTLIVGILQAMQGMAWVLVLTTVLLYAIALLCVRLFGHGLLFGGDPPTEVKEIFPNVPESMFVLFKVMNGDTEPVEPLFAVCPVSRILFVLYMVVSSWAILSILTAVVSENMINATEAHREQLEAESHTKDDYKNKAQLDELFTTADSDENGQLSEQEFDEFLQDHDKTAALSEYTGLQDDELHHVANHFRLTRTRERAVSRKEFISALQTVNNHVTELSVLKLQNRLLDSMDHRLENVEGNFLRLTAKFDEMQNNGTRSDHESAVASSLQRIEKLLDASQETFDRNTVVSTIKASLSRVDTTIEAALAQVVERTEDQFEISKELAAIDSALHAVERRLDYMSGEIFLRDQQEQLMQRLVHGMQEFFSSRKDSEESESILAKLQGHMDLSQEKACLQSLLSKMETNLDLMQSRPIAEPLVQKLEVQLQAHQESTAIMAGLLQHSIFLTKEMAVELLVARIEQKLDTKKERSELERLIGKYEQRLQVDMDTEIAAIHMLSAKLDHGTLTAPLSADIDLSSSPSHSPHNQQRANTPESDQVRGLHRSGATGGTIE